MTEQCTGAWDNETCEGTPHCPPRCPRFVDGEGVPLVVRPYRDGDFDALVTMYENLGPASRTMGMPPADPDRLRDVLATLTEAGWNLVAVDGDRVVGHVGVSPAAAADPEFVVFVAESFQGRGVGSELVRHVVAYAADRDHEALHLEVAQANRQAIRAYRNVDFEVAETDASALGMRLSLDAPVADAVRVPPAER